MIFDTSSFDGKQRIVQELVPGRQITLAHIIANDNGYNDGCCQNGQDLLQSENQHLAELGLVFDAIDQVHFVSSSMFCF